MDERLQHRVQRYGWDRAAGTYEQSWQQQLAPAQDLLMRMADLKPGERVLDIACGTGLVSWMVAAAVGADGELVGTDISEVMVQTCVETAARRGIANATFRRMEAEHLDLPDASFDAAVCGLGMMYVVDFAGSIREMYRVTRPGGRAVSAVWGTRAACGWADIFEIVQRRVNSEVCPMFFQLGTADVQQQLFEAAGFRDVVSERIHVTLDYDSGEAACDAAFAGGPVAMAYSRFDEPTRVEAHREYIESITPFLQDGVYRIPGEFVVTRGNRA